jgi:thioredoxin 1
VLLYPFLKQLIYISVTIFLKRSVFMASDKVIQLSDDSFENEVLKSSTPVLVDFWASWCAPCKAISPVVDGLADEYDGKVKIGKLNVDENPATPGQYGVRGIPTLILFKDGQVVDQVVGAVPKNQLEGLIKKAL